LCTVPIISLENTVTNQRRRDPPRSVATFNPVSAIKLTVVWNLFAFLSESMTIPTSPLLNCASIPSNALSRLNQKLTSCDDVAEGTSLVSLVTAWMAEIHELTCEWRELRKVGSGLAIGLLSKSASRHHQRKGEPSKSTAHRITG